MADSSAFESVGGGGGSTDETFWTSTDESGSLPNSVDLGALTTGLIKITVGAATAIPSTAVAGTDYLSPADIGVTVQAYDATLQSISALGTAANKIIYTTGVNTWALSDITALGRSLLDDATQATMAATIFSGASLTSVTVASGDLVLIQDISDSNNLKTVTAQSIADLSVAPGGAAPAIATFITQTPNATLPNEQALSTLTTGIMKNTTTTGVVSIAVQGTDYYAPGGTDVALADGGTSASLVASNGGLVYSTAGAMAILSGTATANQIPLSGSSSAPAWSTATYPGTTTINRILYSSANNTISEITTGNNSVLATNGSGVPSLTTSLPTAVQVGVNSLNSGTSASSATFWRGDGTWAPAGSSGALVFIATATASGSATIDFSNNLSATYDNYLVVYENVVNATNNQQLQMRVGTGAGSTYQTTNYAGTAAPVGANSANWQASGTGAGDLMSSSATQGNTSTIGAIGHVQVSNVNNASNNKGMVNLQSYPVATTVNVSVAGFQWQGATVLTSLRFLYSSGNISTGTFKLYGIVN